VECHWNRAIEKPFNTAGLGSGFDENTKFLFKCILSKFVVNIKGAGTFSQKYLIKYLSNSTKQSLS